ncbi:MAG: LutB/LldF family L-lactate oxidation iron-sulfur protein [Candidatus Dadabacteria bacterium]|nr:LutB/LldF family L-lactate oxidation iron-sulfur protein [Candidatus Dadabacteria bacterium]MDE0477087.1 LutB/LldF family L-lactate oxidation iron-sulfur protein [Candidatus Dadabacteria bacterium]
MITERIDFKKNSVEALKSPKLKKALVNFTDRSRAFRRKAVNEVSEWEELRSEARRIKEDVINNLDSYLLELEKSVIRMGGNVHWAKDAEEASSIVVDIARENNVRNVVKSKSMATEEIELNRHLISNGINTVETDLGEYIVQLCDDHPFHIIAPAIHKTKEDISKLFSEKFGVPEYEEPEKLTEIARKKLREKFLSADMGVSGVNFAVAESGTIAIVENEGNARLATTVPDIHVAIMGIEKIVPKFEQLSIFLSLLARSATGQKSSTYVSLITGPRREGESDGPRQFHLVFLDNGRSDIARSEETKESLYCIRCGACINICPVYRQVGGHSYGWVYSGPIGAVITPQLNDLEKTADLPFASSLCGACRDVCPVKIDFPHVLLSLRQKVVEQGRKKPDPAGFMEKIAFRVWSFVFSKPFYYNLTGKMMVFLQYFYQRDNELRGLPYPFSKWTKEKNFPAFSKKPFRERWKEKYHGKNRTLLK